MNNKQRANFVAWIHLTWILFGLISLPLLFTIASWNKVVLVFAVITILSWIIFRGCWFLQLENKWRQQHDPAGSFEEEAFVQHYFKKFFNITCSRFAVRAIIYIYMVVLIWISLIQIF